jgi:hypothetical protein
MGEYVRSYEGLGQEAAPAPDPDAPTPRFHMISGPEGTFERINMRVMGPAGLWNDVACYRNFPRETVAPMARPWSLEFDTGPLGDRFSCQTNVMWTTCPPSMQPIPYSPEYQAKKKECDAYKAMAKTKKAAAERDIENEGFRREIAQQIARAAGVPEWRLRFTGPAEFLTVVEERSRRARGIWVLSTLTIAAGGGYLLWKYLRARRGGER